MVRVAINGFGRIGRAVFKLALERGLKVVAINDLTDVRNLAYLLKYDTVYGRYGKKVSARGKELVVAGKQYPVFSERDPENLPWKKLKVDIVVESTGFFTDREGASKHLKAGAKRVLISAPAKNPDITVVKGVNDGKLKGQKIVSNASCTTNCFAPMVKVLDDAFGIRKGFMTTAHAYTSTQRILDGPSHKFRRGRTAAVSIVPTTTGAAKAVIEVLPKMKGKLDAMAIRVPVPVGSITDFTADLKKSVTVGQVNKAFKKAARGKMKGVLEYSEDELVSPDIIGNSHSCIIDGLSTKANGKMVKVLGWYDNEYGYASRMTDVIKLMARKL
ncbi:MAG: type I glyceraldehyde-3-phosphate dehydrogenase [archaeon]|nr:MAG: type I glyceraldehyde-3-phosphate dehydrogenase [archaeon]